MFSRSLGVVLLVGRLTPRAVHTDMQWERHKKNGMAPSKRASFGMVTHRGRALLFGGVTDCAGAGDKVYSELHDELYQLDLTSQRWRPVAFRASRTAKVLSLLACHLSLCAQTLYIQVVRRSGDGVHHSASIFGVKRTPVDLFPLHRPVPRQQLLWQQNLLD
jgi:hypothetical protein